MSDSFNHAGGEADGNVAESKTRHSGRPVDGGREKYVSVTCGFTTRTCAKCGNARFMLFGSKGEGGVDGRPAVMITCENCMDATILTIHKISNPFPMTRDMDPISSAAEV